MTVCRLLFFGVIALLAMSVEAGPETAVREGLAARPLERPGLFATSNEFAAVRVRLADDAVLSNALERVRRNAVRAMRSRPIEHRLSGRRMLGESREALSRILNGVVAWRVLGEPTGRDVAVRTLDEVTAFPDWNPSHFLDTAEMALAVATAYDGLYGDLSSERRDRATRALIELALKPSLEGRWSKNWVAGTANWTSVCHAGMIAAALAVRDREPEMSVRILSRAIENLHRPVKVLEPDGAYPEGPTYWNYGMSFHVIALELLDRALGTTGGLAEMPALRKTAAYPDLVTGPTGKFFNYADSGPGRGPCVASWWFGRRFQMPEVLDLQERRLLAATNDDRVWTGRLFPLIPLWYSPSAPNRPCALPLQWVASGKTPVTAQRTSWKSDAFFVALKGGSPSGPHGHCDIGSFVLEVDGIRWVSDLGPEDYGRMEALGLDLWNVNPTSDRWRIFRYSAFSHNTLILDGQNQYSRGNATAVMTNLSGRLTARIDMTRVYTNATSVVREGSFDSDGRSYRLVDRIEGLRPGASVRWAIMTEADATAEGDLLVLRRQGKTLILRQIGFRAPWKVESCPHPNKWDMKRSDCRQVSFEVPMPDDALTLGVSFKDGVKPCR